MDERLLGGKRTRGKYTLPEEEKSEIKETICVVDFWVDVVHQVSFYGQDRDKIIKLFELVRDGKIRPYEEFGGPQLGKSRQELENDLVALRRTLTATELALSKAWAELEQLKKKESSLITETRELYEGLCIASKKNHAIQQLAKTIGFSNHRYFYWPLCDRFTTARKINAILDSK